MKTKMKGGNRKLNFQTKTKTKTTTLQVTLLELMRYCWNLLQISSNVFHNIVKSLKEFLMMLIVNEQENVLKKDTGLCSGSLFQHASINCRRKIGQFGGIVGVSP
jgi:hypothetical protein